MLIGIFLKGIIPGAEGISVATFLSGVTLVWRRNVRDLPQTFPQCEYCWMGAKIGAVLLAADILFITLLAAFDLSVMARLLAVIFSLIVGVFSAFLIMKYSNCVSFYKKLGGLR